MADPLEALVTDEQHLAREELARALAPYLQLTREGGFVIEPAFDALPAERQVLCVLLGLQALALLGLRASPTATPQEIVELSGMAAGTVRPKLSALRKQRQVVSAGGKYSLPIHAARRAMQSLLEAR